MHVQQGKWQLVRSKWPALCKFSHLYHWMLVNQNQGLPVCGVSVTLASVGSLSPTSPPTSITYTQGGVTTRLTVPTRVGVRVTGLSDLTGLGWGYIGFGLLGAEHHFTPGQQRGHISTGHIERNHRHSCQRCLQTPPLGQLLQVGGGLQCRTTHEYS